MLRFSKICLWSEPKVKTVCQVRLSYAEGYAHDMLAHDADELVPSGQSSFVEIILWDEC